MHLMQRFIVGSVGPVVLPVALRNLQITWGTQEALDASLAHMVAAVANNFTAKHKLRLLRLARSLCPPDFSYDMAVLAVAMYFLEQVIYSAQGHGHHRVSCTALALADARSSPLCNAIHHLAQLLIQWHSDRWLLPRLIGANFEQDTFQLYARRVVLQLLSGLFDICDRRLAMPPYSLAPICSDFPAARKQHARTRFLSEGGPMLTSYLSAVAEVFFLSRCGSACC